MKKFKKGFTLAEVLVTLLIIGIIAALTIPTVISSSTDASLRTTWKKAYGDIVTATDYLSNNVGYIDFTSRDTFREAYKPVLNYLKEDTGNNVFASSYALYKSSSSFNTSSWTYPSIVLANGNVIMFDLCTGSGCIGSGDMYIDVNGKNGPNMMGKDVFFIWVAKKDEGSYVVYPGGSYDGLRCVVGSLGLGCASYALSNDEMP